MRFSRNGFLPCLMAIAVAVFALNITSYAQFSVTVSAPSSSMTVPTGNFDVTATVSNAPAALSKVVFYKNDVPYKTLNGTSTAPYITENLGQDTYTYRAIAYASNGASVESADFNLTVKVPSTKIFRMGEGIPVVSGTPIPTSGPNRYVDHTEDVKKAVKYLSEVHDGGILFFPCSGGSSGTDPQSIYNISDTIVIPNNVTLQGDSAEEGIFNGRCRIYWNDHISYADSGCISTTPTGLKNKAMFSIDGTKARVRFRDLWMVSRTVGRDCGNNGTATRVYNDNVTAILLDSGSSGTISDIILENVSITAFKYGIKAIGNTITDIKIRGVKPVENFRQLSVDATYAYDWDVQNFNMGGMMGMQPGEIEAVRQGAVEIIKAGAPSSYTVENKKLKFLQLNCNGSLAPYADRPAFCLSIKKHGGLYFKQLHMEGIKKALIVEDLGTVDTNSETIIMEHSPVAGEFNDDSMKLYLIGSGILAAPDPVAAQTVNHPDKARMEFIGAGANSTVVDCGDMHGDRTDTRFRYDPDNTPVGWDDWRMSFTHSERNRESFFEKISTNYYLPKAHTVCPANVSGLPNINEVGGEHFNTGVLPVDYVPPAIDTTAFGPCTANTSTCAAQLQDLLTPTGTAANNRGTIRINGLVKVDQPIKIPSGRQIVGGNTVNGNVPEIRLHLSSSPLIGTVDLLQINMNYYTEGNCDPFKDEECLPLPLRVSGITIRNLKLSTNTIDSSGIAIIGLPFTNATGVSSDMHFSGLTIEGFGKGLDVRRFDPSAGTTHQMVDGISWKNINFVGNSTAASVAPSNISNWNIINLNMESSSYQAVGWYHANTGNSTQNVTCKGSETYHMKDCIRLEMASIYLTGLKATDNVDNDITFTENYSMYDKQYTSRVFSNSVLRNNDFTGKGSVMGAFNLKGKSFITSMNNRYKNIFVAQNTASQAEFSRITYCGDIFEVTNTAFPDIAEFQDNLYVGVKTRGLIQCGNNSSNPRPKPWEPVINLADESATVSGPDIPLIGNFNDNVQQDLVIFRQTSPQTKFFVSSIDGRTKQTITWGNPGDIPLVGKFLPGYRSQVVAWREVLGGSSNIWFFNPQDSSYFVVSGWGSNGDIPFAGNFLDESGVVTGNMDEIAVYRPSNGKVYILNPRAVTVAADFTLTSGNSTRIQVGDFLGLGFDQVAQYNYNTSTNTGTWTIVNPRKNSSNTYDVYTETFGGDGDYTPIAGKFFSGSCSQIGVWNETTEKMRVKDAVVSGSPSVTGCGARPVKEMYWGSNNNSPSGSNYYTTDITDCTTGGDCPNDILLKINSSTVDKPVAYRPTNGVFPYSKAKGQWWIHDPFQ